MRGISASATTLIPNNVFLPKVLLPTTKKPKYQPIIAKKAQKKGSNQKLGEIGDGITKPPLCILSFSKPVRNGKVFLFDRDENNLSPPLFYPIHRHKSAKVCMNCLWLS